MNRQRLLPAAALVALGLVVSGCNDQSDKAADDPSSSGSPSASGSASDSATDSGTASPSASPTDSPSEESDDPDAQPGLPSSRLAAASYHKAVLGTSVARTADEKAVVAAWMTYWQTAADTYFNQEVSAAFTKASQGSARASIVNNMRQKKAQDQRVVGWAQDNVTSVKVNGDRATVRDCTKNFTFTVDEEGEPLTRPDPWYDGTGKLTRVDGRWLVTKQTSTSPAKSCLR